jgi:lysozyme family protein
MMELLIMSVVFVTKPVILSSGHSISWTKIMTAFQIAVNYVLNNEKGLEENPKDPGGITKFGISLRFLRNIDARRYGIFSNPITEDDIRNLKIETAKDIYQGEFWNLARFDEIKNQDIINYLFDMVVNEGISPAIKILQRACWAVFEDRSVIKDDGILGDKTLKAVNFAPSTEIIAAMRSERAGDYRVIVAHRPDQKEFIEGWLNRAYNQNREAILHGREISI